MTYIILFELFLLLYDSLANSFVFWYIYSGIQDGFGPWALIDEWCKCFKWGLVKFHGICGQFCCSFEALILKFKGPWLQFAFSEHIFSLFLHFLGAYLWGLAILTIKLINMYMSESSCFWLLVRIIVLLSIMLKIGEGWNRKPDIDNNC